jgi:hypothetical protein
LKKMQHGLHDDVSKAPRTAESSPSHVHFTATEVEFARYRLVHDFKIWANRLLEEALSIFESLVGC